MSRSKRTKPNRPTAAEELNELIRRLAASTEAGPCAEWAQGFINQNPDIIPSPEAIRSELDDAERRVVYLRGLLRIAERVKAYQEGGAV